MNKLDFLRTDKSTIGFNGIKFKVYWGKNLID